MTQAQKLTLDLWPEYLKWLDSENAKIKDRNKRVSAKNKKRLDDYIRLEKDLADAASKEYDKKVEDLKRRQMEWDGQPFYKKLFSSRPDEYVSYRNYPSMMPSFLPSEPIKEPSLEEYLTWQTRHRS